MFGDSWDFLWRIKDIETILELGELVISNNTLDSCTNVTFTLRQ